MDIEGGEFKLDSDVALNVILGAVISSVEGGKSASTPLLHTLASASACPHDFL